MEIVLPSKLEAFVNGKVRAGQYADAQDVICDALRRWQAAEAAEAPNGLVREAIALATQTQRDVLGLIQRADRETDVFHQVMGAAGHAVDASLDVARRIPVAREVEKVVRGSLETVTKTAERGEQDARQMRQGLESTARALGLLATVLEKVNATTAMLYRPPNGTR